MALTIRPLTPDLWPHLEDLFGDKGPVARCWCMHGRIGAAYRRRAPEDNRRDFRQIVEQGLPPGLLAFQGDLAVGWCQVTPRSALPQLDRNWRIRSPDDTPVWSISCFYVRKGHRRQGVTSALIEAASEVARKAGAPAIEAYPLDAELSPSATGTGYASTFSRAGFTVVARRSPEKPIMRRYLQPAKPASSVVKPVGR
jgi:GNAT superfamily N-acetyltransferase